MAFAISKNQPSPPSPHSDQENSAKTKASVTSHLYLKKSSSSPSPSAREHHSQALDRDVVLRRIRHHKRMEKARRNLQAVFGSTPPLADTDDMSAYEHKLLQMGDVFCSP